MKLSTREYSKRLRRGGSQPLLFYFHQDLKGAFHQLARRGNSDIDIETPEKITVPSEFIDFLL